MKDFNLSGYLKNNRLLNESIGGYVDIKPIKFLKEDDEFDEWCQANPEDCKRYKQSQEDADKAFTDEFGSYSSDETNEGDDEENDPKTQQGKTGDTTPPNKPLPGSPGSDDYDYDNDLWAQWIDQRSRDAISEGDLSRDAELGGVEDDFKNLLAKGYSYSEALELIAQNTGMDPDELESLLPQDAVDIEGYVDEDDEKNMKAGKDFKYSDDFLKDLEARKNGTYKYSDADYEMSDDERAYRQSIGSRYGSNSVIKKEAKKIVTKEKPKAKGKLKEGKIRPSSSEFTWDI